MSETQIRGLKELQRALKELPKRVGNKVVRNATRAGAQVIRIEAQKNLASRAKASPESIKSVIEQVATKGRIRQGAIFHVGAKSSRFWLNILEQGAAPHVIRTKKKKVLSSGMTVYGKRVNHPGIRPRPWLRPAFDAHQAEALGVIGKELWRGIKLEAAKLNKKG